MQDITLGQKKENKREKDSKLRPVVLPPTQWTLRPIYAHQYFVTTPGFFDTPRDT